MIEPGTNGARLQQTGWDPEGQSQTEYMRTTRRTSLPGGTGAVRSGQAEWVSGGIFERQGMSGIKPDPQRSDGTEMWVGLYARHRVCLPESTTSGGLA